MELPPTVQITLSVALLSALLGRPGLGSLRDLLSPDLLGGSHFLCLPSAGVGCQSLGGGPAPHQACPSHHLLSSLLLEKKVKDRWPWAGELLVLELVGLRALGRQQQQGHFWTSSLSTKYSPLCVAPHAGPGQGGRWPSRIIPWSRGSEG